MNIAGMARTSTLDFPGRLAAVLFTPGCNYDCFFCHNRKLIAGEEAVLDPAEVDAFLRARSGLLDGMVVSGGEPTLQKDLVEFFEKLKGLQYDTKLDTNGSNPAVVSRLLEKGLVDYVAMDYKAPFSRYREICGQSADPAAVLETLDLVMKSGVAFELRTTVIPQLSKRDLLTMAKEVPPLERYFLQPYKKPESYRKEDRFRVETTPYTTAQLLTFLDELRIIQPHASLRM